MPSFQYRIAAFFACGAANNGETHLNDKELIQLLHRKPHEGWNAFLDAYAKLIYSYAVKSFSDIDMASDFNLFVYESLAANQFKKLKAFRFRCKLSSYLITLLGNLKSDFTRKKFGRKTLPERIKRLPPLAQELFKLCFWETLSRDEAVHRLLSTQGAAVSEKTLYQLLDQIDEALNIKIRGRIQKIKDRKAIVDYQSTSTTISLSENDPLDNLEIADLNLNPDRMLERFHSEKTITAILDQFADLVETLPYQEKRLFLLRFSKGCSAKEIARKMKIRPPERVYMLLNQLKEKMADELTRRGYGFEKFFEAMNAPP